MKRPVSLWTQIAGNATQAAPAPEKETTETATAQTEPVVEPTVAAKPSPDSVRIGDFFVESGRLTSADVETIIKKQTDGNLRFGDAAIALGLLREDEVKQALSKQYQ